MAGRHRQGVYQPFAFGQKGRVVGRRHDRLNHPQHALSGLVIGNNRSDHALRRLRKVPARVGPIMMKWKYPGQPSSLDKTFPDDVAPPLRPVGLPCPDFRLGCGPG